LLIPLIFAKDFNPRLLSCLDRPKKIREPNGILFINF